MEALYSIDGGAFVSVRTFFAQGAIPQAIQQAGVPLMVGLIGTSNTPGAEVEGTWDYLNAICSQPSVPQLLSDVNETVGGAPLDIDLDTFFDDDEGVGNLTYTVESVTNPAFGASIVGSTLTLTFPASVASGAVTIRATGSDGFFVEQTFTVDAMNPVAIYRLNAGGGQVAAIDGGIPWEEDTTGNNSAYLSNPGSNAQAGFNIVTFTPEVDQATTPVVIYQTERWSNNTGTPAMTYAFPVAARSTRSGSTWATAGTARPTRASASTT